MEAWDLLRHVADNLEAGRAPSYGLFYMGQQSIAESVNDIDFGECDDYSLAPRTRVINGFTVPAPMENKPDLRQGYWYESPTEPSFALGSHWAGDNADQHRFAIGIYETAEAAAANCKARYGIDPKWGE